MAGLYIPVVAYGSSAPLYQVKPREDGRGPYRWSHVVKSGQGGLRQGSIYRKIGDELTPRDVAWLVSLCDKAGFDMRRTS